MPARSARASWIETFGPEVRFLGIPPGMKPNRPPSDGLQFFGTLKVDGRTRALTATLRNVAGDTLFSVELPAGTLDNSERKVEVLPSFRPPYVAYARGGCSHDWWSPSTVGSILALARAWLGGRGFRLGSAAGSGDSTAAAALARAALAVFSSFSRQHCLYLRPEPQ